MILRRLQDMVGGWLVGNFEPSCYKTDACEVACKRYNAGDTEAAHVHLVATEITLVTSGRVVMNGRVLSSGDIIVLEPGEPADFTALEPTTTLVVKLPGVLGDKYPIPPADGFPAYGAHAV